MDNTITVTLYSAERIGCSVNGNPTWNLHTSEGTFRTMSDSGVGYEVGNYLPRRHKGEDDPTVVLTLTRAGRVRAMHAESPAERTAARARSMAAHPAGKRRHSVTQGDAQ